MNKLRTGNRELTTGFLLSGLLRGSQFLPAVPGHAGSLLGRSRPLSPELPHLRTRICVQTFKQRLASDARCLLLYCQGNGGVRCRALEHSKWPLADLFSVSLAEDMKFANKYELFEAVTSGRVETFFAKDLTSGERVLLHIFEAPEKKPDQPTLIWVLESFRKVAPEPPGLVVETGRYSGTTYAYLVTKLPDDASLRRWTQSYDSHVKETQESAIWSEGPPPVSPTTSKDPAPPLDRPAESPRPMPNAKPPGDFTAAFSGLPSPVVSPSEANTSGATALDGITSAPGHTATQRAPGEFTKQFFSGLHESPQELAPQAPAKSSGEAVAPPKSEAPPNRTGTPQAPKKEATQSQPPKPAPSSSGLTGTSTPAVPQDSGGFTALFRSDFKSESQTSPESHGPPSKSADAKPEDFTDFFRGPFDGERPAETPAILPKLPDAPQRNAPGEFTRVFGSGKSSDLPATPPLHSPVGDFSRQDEAGSTQMFSGVGQPAAAPPANTPSQTWDPLTPKSEVSPLSKEAAWTAPPLRPSPPVTPSIEPIPPKPSTSNSSREPEPPAPAGATHVFSVVRPPLSSPHPVPGGPSEYTRIISGGMGSNTADNVPVAPPKAAAPPPPKFSPPPLPPPPKVPQLEVKAPKPKASYLPLVIILNVLLFLAILLIVYFEIKH